MPNVDPAVGKIFIHRLTKEAYGPLRLPYARSISTLDGTSLDVIADDDCGNSFTLAIDGTVKFWDHETDELVNLADSVREFVEGCTDSPETVLHPNQVKSVWVQPGFAKSLGVEVPADGWVKKPSK